MCSISIYTIHSCPHEPIKWARVSPKPNYKLAQAHVAWNQWKERSVCRVQRRRLYLDIVGESSILGVASPNFVVCYRGSRLMHVIFIVHISYIYVRSWPIEDTTLFNLTWYQSQGLFINNVYHIFFLLPDHHLQHDLIYRSVDLCPNLSPPCCHNPSHQELFHHMACPAPPLPTEYEAYRLPPWHHCCTYQAGPFLNRCWCWPGL